jgi:GTP-binding protein LepA
MIFDSVYDVYRGVITYVRVIDGRIEARDRIKMMSTGAVHELLEIGVISPEPIKSGALGVGEVGYLMTGREGRPPVPGGRHGDHQLAAGEDALGGYKDPKPMVYSGCTRSTARTTRICVTRWTS